MQIEFFRHILEKSLNIKYHEYTSSGNRVVPYGRTVMTKLRVAFRNFCERAKLVFYKKIQVTLHKEHSVFRSGCVPSPLCLYNTQSVNTKLSIPHF